MSVDSRKPIMCVHTCLLWRDHDEREEILAKADSGDLQADKPESKVQGTRVQGDMKLDYVEKPGQRGMERKASWSGQGTKKIKI